jgi:hypothetical protein
VLQADMEKGESKDGVGLFFEKGIMGRRHDFTGV